MTRVRSFNMPSSASSDSLAPANKLIASGLYEEAVVLLYNAVKQQPMFFQGWLLLSRCLYEVGHEREAVKIAQHAERYDPLLREFQHIQQCMQSNDLETANDIATKMLNQEPHHPRAYFTQAAILLRKNQPERASELLSQALIHLPANLTLRHQFIASLTKTMAYSRALSEGSLLIELDPCFDTLWAQAGLLLKYGQYDALLRLCQGAAEYADGNDNRLSEVLLMRGQALRIIGQREASITALQASIQANRLNVDAWWALADFKNYRFSSNEIAQLTALTQLSSLPNKSRAIATFALAKAHEHSNGLPAAMQFYQVANELVSTNEDAITRMKDEFALRKRTFNADNLRHQAKCTISSSVPIFIVGLPRSGTTLVEQILASHSQIQGTIEQPTLPHLEQTIERYCQETYDMGAFDALKHLSIVELTHFSQLYLNEGALFRTDASVFFIDKQPFNYRLIGWIHKLFPQAKIIDVRRHPLDCGLSLYTQYFHSGVDFSYCWRAIGHAYNDYVNLMAHWHSLLPGKVLQLDYEALIAAPEQQVSQLLAYIGVPFEPSCLAFHTLSRPVHTASSEQVRQPLNSNAIGRWRQVDPWLGTLKETLESSLLAESIYTQP